MGTREQPAAMYRWIDDDHIAVDDTVFRLIGSGEVDGAAAHDQFFIQKPRRLVERYLRHVDEFYGGRIFEVGIFHGGSTAFLAAALEPEKLVAVDLHTNRNGRLDRWLDKRGQSEQVRIYHGVDQADRDTIRRLIADEFAGRPLDLVIDDASHLLTPSTATFNLLFPRLRPGGLYVIEDWSWDLVFRLGIGQRLGELDEVLRRDPGRWPRQLPSARRWRCGDWSCASP